MWSTATWLGSLLISTLVSGGARTAVAGLEVATPPQEPRRAGASLRVPFSLTVRHSSSVGDKLTWNFGQRPYADAAPSGFKALCTQNLPAPAIKDGSKYFQTTLYTGTGSTLEVNQSENSTFQPDFVWIKKRSGTDRHELEDAVRGASLRLSSDRTDAEDTGGLTSFDADGFTVDGLYGSSGESGFTYAAWQWLAANGTVSNTDGTITSTVSANTDGGVQRCYIYWNRLRCDSWTWFIHYS
jgi:hypothetical protein